MSLVIKSFFGYAWSWFVRARLDMCFLNRRQTGIYVCGSPNSLAATRLSALGSNLLWLVFSLSS
jgi:hypothetical protein